MRKLTDEELKEAEIQVNYICASQKSFDRLYSNLLLVLKEGRLNTINMPYSLELKINLLNALIEEIHDELLDNIPYRK